MITTPLKAVRLKCLECAGYRPSQVRKCDSKDCPLYFYRMGHNPHRKGIGGRGNPEALKKHNLSLTKISKKGISGGSSNG